MQQMQLHIKIISALKTIVIGAHYDHIGYGVESSLTPDLNIVHIRVRMIMLLE